MTTTIRNAILNLVKTVQETEPWGNAPLLALSDRANDPRLPPDDGSGTTVQLRLEFGRGYFDGRKVLFWVDNEYEEVETEEGVAAFCEHRLPEGWRRR